VIEPAEFVALAQVLARLARLDRVQNRKVLERLFAAGVRPVAEKKAKGPQTLAGEIIVFTGGLEAMTRPEGNAF